MSLYKEIRLEDRICECLAGHGWLYAEGDHVYYDRQLALYPPDVLAWARETQPKAWGVLVKSPRAGVEETLLGRLRDKLDQRDTLGVLRHGVELLQERRAQLISTAGIGQFDAQAPVCCV